jgi:SIR2-like domain
MPGVTGDSIQAEAHYDSVVTGLRRGRVTPVLGAGVNLCARAAGEPQTWLGRFPPSGSELASYLAHEFKYPPSEPVDLLRVSQYVYAVRGGSGPLYDVLHEVFDRPYATTPVHDFLASVAPALRGSGNAVKPPLIVTTNYDDLMESALAAAGEPYDLIVYVAEGPHEGRFCLWTPDGTLEPIVDARTNIAVDPDRRTVVLKIHGFVDRRHSGDDNEDSYVITEDHYIEYLTRMNLDDLIPVKILERLRNCHFLFLGYSLTDWNLRAILYRLWSDRRRDRDWWAIQVNPGELERKSWRRRGVEILDISLEEYVERLQSHFSKSLPA